MRGDHYISDNFVVLLTSCIKPGNISSLERRDTATRLNDYIKSLTYYLHLPCIPNIVFCDNSGVDLVEIKEVIHLNNIFHKNVEILSFYGQPDNPEYGKGFGEMRIIGYALDHSCIIRETSMIMKITGRLIVTNSELIAKEISKINDIDVFCDLRQNLTTTDSRLFCATPYFLKKYFITLQVIMNESMGICFEEVLARAVHHAMADGLRWAMLPVAHDVRGIAGTANKKIPSSRWSFLLRELFRFIKSMILYR